MELSKHDLEEIKNLKKFKEMYLQNKLNVVEYNCNKERGDTNEMCIK